MVVPYHPAVLLAWGAHMNLQAVTDTAWSYYLLTYAAKEQLPANLALDGKALAALGLQGVGTQQASLAAAVVMSRPICPCEAALITSGIPIVACSDSVTYIDTRPPPLRTLWVRNNSSFGGTSALATYAGRPHEPEFDDLTLPLSAVRGEKAQHHCQQQQHQRTSSMLRAQPASLLHRL